MAVRYSPIQANSGLDTSVSPNWQMVPVGGVRVLAVRGSAGLIPRVRSAGAGAAPLTAVKSGTGANVRLTLTGGRAAGHAWVEWVPSADSVDPVASGFTLEVSVKAEKPVRTAFHYVDDGRKQKTKRKVEDLDRLIARVNAILTPQSNVKMVRKSADPRPVAQNLGDIVRFSSHLEGAPDNVAPAQHEWDDLLALVDATADFNVFFVKEYEQDNTPYRDNTDAGTIAADKMCIYEDDQSHDAAGSLAHETIHGLGVPDHSASSHHVMATGRNGIGRFITRDQANTINPSGT